VQQAITAIGWTAPATYDGQFSASTASGDMETAINNGAQALILISITPSTVASALQLAQSKNVAVVCILCGPPSTFSAFPGIVGVEPSPANIGIAQADWVIVNSKGTAKVWVYEDQEFAETIAQTAAAEATIRTKCGGCQLHIAQTQAGDEQQPGIPVLAGVLAANPKGTINDIIAPYDGAAANFATFAAQDGRPEINFVGYAGLPDMFDEIAEGTPPGAKATVSIPLPYMGWSAIDEVARLLDQQPTWNANNLNVALITRQNVNQFNATNPYVNPTFNFKAMFLKLWGK
jgi:ribose transport system substrate-binding protein